jgi:hypothetical protein
MILCNVGIWRPREDICVCSLVTTFTNDFKFITKNGVDLQQNHQGACRNPSFGLTTKARACKGAGQEWSPKVTFHAPESVGEGEGMNLHTPKWASTLGVGAPMDPWIFKRRLQGSKLIGLKSFYIIGKLLKCRCPKWACMTHLGK